VVGIEHHCFINKCEEAEVEKIFHTVGCGRACPERVEGRWITGRRQQSNAELQRVSGVTIIDIVSVSAYRVLPWFLRKLFLQRYCRDIAYLYAFQRICLISGFRFTNLPARKKR